MVAFNDDFSFEPPALLTYRSIRPGITPHFRHRFEFPPGRVPPGNHNGASSPFRFLYPLIYTDEQRAAIDEASYLHDWLYMYGRLPGAPGGTEYLTRGECDRLYRQYYLDHGFNKIATVHYLGVRLGGGRPWRRNARFMAAAGDDTYIAYLNRKTAEALKT